MNKQFLYIFCGIPFSGKTTIAKKLAEKFGFVRVDLDEIKFDLFGKEITDGQMSHPEWNKIYKEMYKSIKEKLEAGKTVICDTGNFTKKERNLVRKIAVKLKIKVKTVFIDTPYEVAKTRWLKNKFLRNRFDISEKAFDKAFVEMERPTNGKDVTIYDGKIDMDEWISKFF